MLLMLLLMMMSVHLAQYAATFLHDVSQLMTVITERRLTARMTAAAADSVGSILVLLLSDDWNTCTKHTLLSARLG